MRYLITTFANLEQLLLDEAISYGLSGEVLCSSRIIVSGDIESFKANSQLAINIIRIIENFKFVSFEDIASKKLDGSFKAVTCDRSGTHHFNSQNIRNAFVSKVDIDKSSSNHLFIDIFDKFCTIGFLLTEKKLSTRGYFLRISPSSVPPLIAAAAVRFSNYNKDLSIGDPFCRDGSILIEAHKFGFSKLHGVDNENHIRNAKVNAQLANADVDFHVGLYDSLTNIDVIITRPFEFFSKSPEDLVAKRLRKFFDSIKKNNIKEGTLIMTAPGIISKILEEFDYKIIKELKVPSGMLVWNIISFGTSKD